MEKSQGGAVDQAKEFMGFSVGECPSVHTVDSIDGTELTAVQHPDGDVSIYVGEVCACNEMVMSKEQAAEFFTKALTLCN